MIIETKNGVLPNIVNELKWIDKNSLHYNTHNLKHPLAIYNTSFSKIEDSLTDFFKIFNQISFDTLKDASKTIEALKKYRIFLYSLNEHLDDCFHIIKTFIPPSNNFKEGKNQFYFLRNNLKEINSLALSNFLNSINGYKTHIGTIVNSLKHDNSMIKPIIFYEDDLKKFSIGYFIANVVKEKYQPLENIHPKFYGSFTGFSFNRDIRWHIYNIYEISEFLIKFINNFKLKVDKKSLVNSNINNKKNNLYTEISKLKRRFFPDEYSKPIPSIAILNEKFLKLECPSKLSLKRSLNQITVLHTGDGVTRSFVIPYI